MFLLHLFSAISMHEWRNFYSGCFWPNAKHYNKARELPRPIQDSIVCVLGGWVIFWDASHAANGPCCSYTELSAAQKASQFINQSRGREKRWWALSYASKWAWKYRDSSVFLIHTAIKGDSSKTSWLKKKSLSCQTPSHNSLFNALWDISHFGHHDELDWKWLKKTYLCRPCFPFLTLLLMLEGTCLLFGFLGLFKKIFQVSLCFSDLSVAKSQPESFWSCPFVCATYLHILVS